MADAAVEFLLNNLKELLLYHSHLITDTKKQIESLDTDLRLFNAFLKDSMKKRRKDERTKELVRSIRDVVYEVEDVIDAFITQAMEKKSTSAFLKFWKPSVKLHDIGKKVEEVREKVDKARVDFANLSVHDQDDDEKSEVNFLLLIRSISSSYLANFIAYINSYFIHLTLYSKASFRGNIRTYPSKFESKRPI